MPSVRNRLQSYGLVPHKSLGQNFLTDPDVARRIVAYAQIEQADTVIEVGPGIGALTQHLTRVARQVIAIEIDRHLIPALTQELGEQPNLTVIQGDALEADFEALALQANPGNSMPAVRFVGNLPYYITSAVIRRMLESPLRPRSLVLTVQLEVAQRMVARPNDMSLLAVGVQFYGKPEILMHLDPSLFYPQPDVDSAVVRITPYAQPLSAQPDAVFALAHAGFSQKRKQLRNTIAGGLNITKGQSDELLTRAGVDPTRRAETLGLQEWVDLADAYGRNSYGMANRSLNADSEADSNSAEPAPNAANTTEL